MTSAELEALMPAVLAGLSDYPYDKFRWYPARGERDGRAPWESYLLARLQRIADDPDWTLCGSDGGAAGPLLIGARTADWDRDQFGITVSSLTVLYCPDQAGCADDRMRALLDACLAELKAAGVRFVSARVNGDQLDVVHALEDAGFRYYETLLWPVMATAGFSVAADPRVRLLADGEVDRAAQIAAEHGYPRTHFLCDAGFSRPRVMGTYAKWITTAWEAGDPITVIEVDGEVAGVFALRFERDLAQHLGWTYGRTRFVAVDPAYRGRGLGRALFYGSVDVMKRMGAEYLDSGYSTRNHVSARIHADAGFRPVYEESTFHLWL
jgi:GNAT superfamily N-acetyltransferase